MHLACRCGYTGEIDSSTGPYEGRWSRSPGQAGYIYIPAWESAAAEYSSYGVFACSPHLPLVVMPGDPTTPRSADDQCSYMHALHFLHRLEPDLVGVSFATPPYSDHLPRGLGPFKHLAGARSALVPGLVPGPYAHPDPDARHLSRGLAGELPILLGMMAFSRRNVHDVFLGRPDRPPGWQNRAWLNGHAPALCWSPAPPFFLFCPQPQPD